MDFLGKGDGSKQLTSMPNGVHRMIIQSGRYEQSSRGTRWLVLTLVSEEIFHDSEKTLKIKCLTKQDAKGEDKKSKYFKHNWRMFANQTEIPDKFVYDICAYPDTGFHNPESLRFLTDQPREIYIEYRKKYSKTEDISSDQVEHHIREDYTIGDTEDWSRESIQEQEKYLQKTWNNQEEIKKLAKIDLGYKPDFVYIKLDQARELRWTIGRNTSVKLISLEEFKKQSQAKTTEDNVPNNWEEIAKSPNLRIAN